MIKTAVQARPATLSDGASILLAALLGVSLVFLAGFAQSAVMHDAAHDVRHAVGFACH